MEEHKNAAKKKETLYIVYNMTETNHKINLNEIKIVCKV